MLKISLILVCLAAATIAETEVEKISSSVIRLNSTIYTFFSPNYFSVILAFQQSQSENYYYVLPINQPPWRDTNNRVDADPDVNFLGDDQIRVYFAAIDKSGRSALGVAMTDSLVEVDYRFITLTDPILVATGKEKLAHPSLYKAPDGGLFLYYQNSTANTYGAVSRVQLTPDGLRVKT